MTAAQSTVHSTATTAPTAPREFEDARSPAIATRYVVTVDTEEEWDWNSGWPSGKPSVENIELLPEFQDLSSRHNASFTYFTNYAVVDDDRASDLLLELASRPGVEIGMHIHPWNTPPLANGKPTARDSFLKNLFGFWR